MPRCFALLLAFLTSLPICGCSKARDPFEGAKDGQLKILTSFPPLYCFAANVAGERAKVLCLLTDTGPHDYQATPYDSIKVAKADLFLVNGLGLDEFVTKLVSDARAKSSVVFEVGETIGEKNLIHLSDEQRVHVHADGSKCTHGEHDPHVWLGTEHAQVMVKGIAKKLGELRPAEAATFEAQAATYNKQLQELHAYGVEKFKGKQNRRIIVTHDFLRYFAQGHQIEIAGSIQSTPGTEADAGQLAKLVKLCKEKDVQVIVVEPQYSKGSAESLQRELLRRGITMRFAEFDPMETATAVAAGNPDPALYLRRMRDNIDNLAKALP